MLKYNRTDVSEGTDVNRTTELRTSIICNYCYFLTVNFNFSQKHVMVVMV